MPLRSGATARDQLSGHTVAMAARLDFRRRMA